VFEKTTMTLLREKSVKLTGHLEFLLRENFPDHHFQIITPANPDERGAQLSLLFRPDVLEAIIKQFTAYDIIVDERRPDVIRVAPAPLYNTYEEIWEFASILRIVLDSISNGGNEILETLVKG